jgi:hypothetical protein
MDVTLNLPPSTLNSYLSSIRSRVEVIERV